MIYDPYEEVGMRETYPLNELIQSVNDLIKDGWSVDIAIEGIAEGHELVMTQIEQLRQHFGRK